MLQFLNAFRADQDGAVTVDWVVLTAAIVGLAVGAYATLEANTIALHAATGGAIAAENDF